jgi:hypothetical protein
MLLADSAPTGVTAESPRDDAAESSGQTSDFKWAWSHDSSGKKNVSEEMKGGWLVQGEKVTAHGKGYYWFQGTRQGLNFAGSVMNTDGEVVGSWDAAAAAPPPPPPPGTHHGHGGQEAAPPRTTAGLGLLGYARALGIEALRRHDPDIEHRAAT